MPVEIVRIERIISLEDDLQIFLLEHGASFGLLCAFLY
jgi:hypothetical protein